MDTRRILCRSFGLLVVLVSHINSSYSKEIVPRCVHATAPYHARLKWARGYRSRDRNTYPRIVWYQ